jgi:hypothetical protein
MTLAAITSMRRELAEWAQRDGNRKFLRDDQEAQLHAALADREGRDAARTAATRVQVQVAAWMLGTWHLGNGLCRVLDGEAAGFDDARTGQGMRRAALLLRAGGQDGLRRRRRAKLPYSTLHGAWTVLLGLALDDPDAEDLYDGFREQPEGTFAPDDHLPLFARELLVLRHGKRPATSTRLGPYQPVVMSWHGDARVFAQKLAEILDLHVKEVRGPGSCFDDPACRLYPVEVLAVRAVRRWLDLEMPKVDHPLMFTNLGTMEPRTKWPRSDLVDRLMQLARER